MSYSKKESSFYEAENKKLKRQVKSLQKENNQLKSQVRTVNAAWNKTERFLSDITDDRPLSEMIKSAKLNQPLVKRHACPVCDSEKYKKILFKKFHILSCMECKYKKKVDEESEVE